MEIMLQEDTITDIVHVSGMESTTGCGIDLRQAVEMYGEYFYVGDAEDAMDALERITCPECRDYFSKKLLFQKVEEIEQMLSEHRDASETVPQNETLSKQVEKLALCVEELRAQNAALTEEVRSLSHHVMESGKHPNTAVPEFVIHDGVIVRCMSMSGVTDVVIPEGVTGIGSYAFAYCEQLASVAFPEGLTNIADDAFHGCKGLTSVTFPESLESIGMSAFNGCEGLTSVTFPKRLNRIRMGAFSGCRGLTSVTLPEGLTSLEDYAFFACEGLALVSFPEGLRRIGESVFWNCKQLTSVALPEHLKRIGKYAFAYCKGLTSVALPEGLKSIGEGAFADCNSLEFVVIPAALTDIGTDVFKDCDALTDVAYRGKMSETEIAEKMARLLPKHS